MNVYINQPRGKSRAIDRIKTALWKHLPKGTHIVSDIANADLVLMIVIGRHDQNVIFANQLKAEGKEYAVMQLALKSTRNPNPADWMELWQDAKVVWSYYDLPITGNFYHSPLGADPELFRPLKLERTFIIGTTGDYTRAECLLECQRAARMTNQSYLHIHNVSDDELNYLYNQCEYVSGLRHREGFELPAAEALFCGARPIMFDTPNYWQWFDGLAEFIPEGHIEDVTASLVELFKKEIRPVTYNEMHVARHRFDWSKIINGFWERCNG